MMNLFSDIDGKLFDKLFEPIAHWVQYEFGKSPYWLALHAIYGWFIFGLIDLSINPDPVYLALDGLAMLVYIPRIKEYLCEDKKFLEGNSSSVMPYNRVHSSLIGLRLLLVSISFAVAVILVLAPTVSTGFAFGRIICFAAQYYFECCSPKPPSHRREQRGITEPTLA